MPAKILGYDANSDIALLRVDTAGLKLTPLPLGSSAHLVVGAPVAAIGSPFGEPQSLSVGVISALDRTIDSLTAFQIDGAIQTDAAVNHGNSGGPLVDAHGRVLGVNSQIRSTGGGGEGVGFAVPVDTVRRFARRSCARTALHYAYLGISSTPLFPPAHSPRFHLPTARGAWIQSLTAGGPADRAGLKAGDRKVRFQVRYYYPDGDIIFDDRRPCDPAAARTISCGRSRACHPGETSPIVIYRGKDRAPTVRVKLGTPADLGLGGPAALVQGPSQSWRARCGSGWRPSSGAHAGRVHASAGGRRRHHLRHRRGRGVAARGVRRRPRTGGAFYSEDRGLVEPSGPAQ